MTRTWHLTPYGAIYLIAMLALLLLGIHMLVQPGIYVGRGPIPAQSTGDVRAMGLLFTLLGGIFTATFTAPLFLLH
jgi:hypothetical protein